jgi:hypothetical protein
MPHELRAALIAALVLGAAGCVTPDVAFRTEDLRDGPQGPLGRVIVGKHVIIRLDPGSGGSLAPVPPYVDVWLTLFPTEADLGAVRVRTVRDHRVFEGAAIPWHLPGTSRYRIEQFWRQDAGTPAEGVDEPDGTMAWLGPVCVKGVCEVFGVGERDWPPPEPPP